MARPDLDQLQRWMQAVITHPGGVAAGIDSAEAQGQIDVCPASIERVISRSQRRTSAQRLEVYANAYFARLLECLRESFPVLVHALGEDVFDQFALGYLQRYPSTSYTLGRLADHFVAFLKETRSELEEEHADGQASWPDFVIDLARLEWTIDQVFDGPGVEDNRPLLPAELQSIDPATWPDARLEPVVCLRLLRTEYPVNNYFTAVRREEDPPLPDPQASFVALTRRDYVVRRIAISQPQYELLTALAAGSTVGEAIAAAAQNAPDIDALAASLSIWFQNWAEAGLFARVITA